ncbi:uncharacterized protein PADG_05276 [Paracoccidioides brasiliensis Pb18]|uniref:MOSC domain-containing protein n=1 Tax=Paracoccidioides brasiliensis (strain Pb18) TaxID=502780 RepID=C1GDE0_PARBD|nr:uncharacterized protein PADG_05276 [Paracoccidioides brasiliensis Pb18]EEH49197.2 hypothetical protein PADG_05276 [Paracoccidioides brasiliensis Pb18]
MRHQQRKHRWATGDRVVGNGYIRFWYLIEIVTVWGYDGEASIMVEPYQCLFLKLLSLRKPIEMPSKTQLVYGNLAGNVRIDLSLYFRPVEFAEATIGADRLLWYVAGEELIRLIGVGRYRLRMLVRALTFRIVATSEGLKETGVDDDGERESFEKALYIYPIKSLRGTPISHSRITRHGLAYDRRFMLLKVEHDKTLRNMQISKFNEMSLFRTDVLFPRKSAEGATTEEGKIVVKYQAPVGHPDRDVVKELEIPLEPADVEGLRIVEVDMYSSACKAYDMGKEYSNWFSGCFGYEVILLYLGENRRLVLGDLPPNAAAKGRTTAESQSPSNKRGGWMSSITEALPFFDYDTSSSTGNSGDDDEWITFADIAAYLIVSETSLQDVSSRLPECEAMDISKFRANIVLSGAAEPYEEDFWGEVTVKDDIKFTLTSNCARCRSINVDYNTGAQGIGESGAVLKKLMKDRRVDKGSKQRPVFGRYGFIDKASGGAYIKVGDEAVVSTRNKKHTVFYWPKLTS